MTTLIVVLLTHRVGFSPKMHLTKRWENKKILLLFSWFHKCNINNTQKKFLCGMRQISWVKIHHKMQLLSRTFQDLHSLGLIHKLFDLNNSLPIERLREWFYNCSDIDKTRLLQFLATHFFFNNQNGRSRVLQALVRGWPEVAFQSCHRTVHRAFQRHFDSDYY